MKTFEEFARDIISDIDKRYELYKLCQTPEKLIGLKVVAITAGFGCGSEGGTKMTIAQVDKPRKWKDEILIDVHFKPNEDTESITKQNNPNGWLCFLHELPHSVKPY